MIEKTIGYKVGEHYFSTIEEAQTEELVGIFKELDDEKPTLIAKVVSELIVQNKDAILTILTDKPTRKYKTRAAKSEKKSRKAITEPPAE